ncbi:polysaccharide pyruvyl transferase family protein [Parabacteroides bouchesdurhonensis]|uniref:polysaccharide pyruvyl transferase family protein n=1 Tax=Parabacteroides bouchesdurhonensis TaxID=1936995 RepID=UPI0011C40E54|nr:polysaccharide pyruvyl transferase family protein [Parabacteroides bouchesdurhonensis]
MKQNKKIGLISYHSGHNYGTMLQAYALQFCIEKMGHDAVEYINYVDGKPFKEASFRVKLKKIKDKLNSGIIPLLYNCLYKKDFLTTRDRFNRFYSAYIKTSSVLYSSLAELKENPPVYDIYIVGSDQTWNPTFLKDNGAYFLTFAAEDANKNSYASSLGVALLSDEVKKTYADYLRSFNHISCRESYGCEMLSDVLKREVEHVLDPTLLLTPDDWSKIESSKIIAEPYVLCYCLGYKKSVRDFAKKLGKAHNMKVYYIVSNYLDIQEKNHLFGIGPDDFISLIRYASYVCTDSFHGTIFSINYGRNFYSFCKRDGNIEKGDNSRIPTLLREFSLENRLKSDVFEEESDIDYETVSAHLNDERQRSIDFLNKILK